MGTGTNKKPSYEDCIDNGSDRPGRFVPVRVLVGEGLRGPRNDPPLVGGLSGTDRAPGGTSPFPPALCRHG